MDILLIDDEPTQRMLLSSMCERFGYRVTTAENGEEGLLHLKQPDADKYQLVLTDLYMPVVGGRQLVRELHELRPDLPVIVITAESSQAVADELKALGAQDFLVKPISKGRLQVSIENAVHLKHLRSEVQRLHKQEKSGFGFDALIGAYCGLEPSVRMARKYASSEMPVLLTGESGVGKEVFAHAIHAESARAGAPFIAINCGALPPNLVESTLFGHEKGSFTGAVERALGKFREAEGGTLFLDEVGELPLETQVKLLRALQQSEVEPVGLGRAVKVNVRIISATNRPLEARVQEGAFRDDLFFRLAVLPLELPALRERREDIPDLAQHFLARICAREAMAATQLDEGALAWAMQYNWPGNVRELENTLSRAALLAEEGAAITRGDLEPAAKGQVPARRAAPGAAASAFDHADGTPKSIEEVTIELVRLRLAQTDEQMTQAAQMLGMPVSTLYRKLREWRDAGKWE